MDASLPGTLITVCVQVLGFGIFIGMTRTQLSNIADRLRRIENNQDSQNKEIVELRERVAVIESILEIKKHK